MEEREERFLVKGDYQIFYQERGEFIEILHIWDSRRDPEDFPL
jgi:plasmid stabilization system protein ParE